MEPRRLVKIKPIDLDKLAKEIELPIDVTGLLNSKLDAAQLIAFLFERERYNVVINLLAYTLPVREAVLWACIFFRETSDIEFHPMEKQAMMIAEKWVYQPSHDLRWEAKKIADKLQFKSGVAWLCMAVFLSGGSIVPDEGVVVMPPSGLFSKSLAGAISLELTAQNKKITSPELAKQAVLRGLNIAMGGRGDPDIGETSNKNLYARNSTKKMPILI